MVLWRKFPQFRPEEDFRRWAFGVAKYEVLAWYRDRGRDRTMLSGAMVEILADDAILEDSRLHAQQEFLDRCMGKLDPRDRQLILASYRPAAARGPGGGGKPVRCRGCGRLVALGRRTPATHDPLRRSILTCRDGGDDPRRRRCGRWSTDQPDDAPCGSFGRHPLGEWRRHRSARRRGLRREFERRRSVVRWERAGPAHRACGAVCRHRIQSPHHRRRNIVSSRTHRRRASRGHRARWHRGGAVAGEAASLLLVVRRPGSGDGADDFFGRRPPPSRRPRRRRGGRGGNRRRWSPPVRQHIGGCRDHRRRSR